MNLLILIITYVVHVMGETMNVEHDIASLREIVVQQASEISILKNIVRDDERQNENHRNAMDAKFKHMMEKQIHQASEIAVLKKKVGDGENAITTLKNVHRKEKDFIYSGFRKLEKQLTACHASSKSNTKETSERKMLGKYIRDNKNINDQMWTLEKKVTESQINIEEAEKIHSSIPHPANDLTESETSVKGVYDTGDSTPNFSHANNIRTRDQRQLSDNRVSGNNIKRRYHADKMMSETIKIFSASASVRITHKIC